MKAKTTLMIVLLAVLAACGTAASGEPADRADPLATWAAAVWAEGVATVKTLMAGDTTGIERAIRSAHFVSPWETTTIVAGPTPVAEGQQYALHWERPQSSPEQQHRCSLIVLDPAGKIRTDGKYVPCEPFEPFK